MEGAKQNTRLFLLLLITWEVTNRKWLAWLVCWVGAPHHDMKEGREPPTPTPNPRQSQKQREQRQGKARRYYVLTSFLTLLTHTTKAKEGKAQETGRKESNTDTGFVDPGYRLLLSFPHRSDNT